MTGTETGTATGTGTETGTKSGSARVLAFVAVLTIGLAAVGGTVAADADDRCAEWDGDEPAVVGALEDGDGPYGPGDELSLHAGSTLEVAYCDADGARSGRWLDESGTDGFAVESAADGSYELEITGEASTIEFAEHVDAESAPDGLVVTVPSAARDGALEAVDLDDESAERYRTAAANFERELEALEATSERIENGDRADLDGAAETLATLERRYETVTERETAVIDALVAEANASGAVGAVGAIEAVDADRRDRAATLEETTDAYRAALETERAEPRSTVRLSLFGPLLGGLLVGGVAGAAIPLVAARRIEEKLKLSRNVSYDLRVALVPMLVGLVLAGAGLAVLAGLVDGATVRDLLAVVR